MRIVSSLLLLLLFIIIVGNHGDDVAEDKGSQEEKGSNNNKKVNYSRQFGPFHEEKDNDVKDIFLPLEIDGDGKINGVLLEDTDPEKGPIVIEEILDTEGNVKEVKVERVNDLMKNYEEHSKIGRKLGPKMKRSNDHSNTTNKDNSTFKITILLFFVLFVVISISIILCFILKMPKNERERTKSMCRNCELPKNHKSYYLYDEENEGVCGSPVKSPLRSPSRRNSFFMQKNIKLNDPF